MKQGDRLDFFDHLEELRSRLMRSVIYVVVLTIVGWAVYYHAYWLIARPAEVAAHRFGGRIVITNPLEAFWVRMQVSVILGLIMAGPFLFWEAWKFVSPGLTGQERRAVLPLLFASAFLGLGGAAFCYLLCFRMFLWITGLAPKGVQPLFHMGDTILLVAKLMLAFALCFQVPVAIVILVKVGIISPDFLARRRREAIVALVVLAAVVTPTGDPLTLLMLAGPLYVMYEGTVAISKIIYRRRAAAIARAATSASQGG
jgi:sec-independent protein translocase protein TatC